jgi:hypothetical protein
MAGCCIGVTGGSSFLGSGCVAHFNSSTVMNKLYK